MLCLSMSFRKLCVAFLFVLELRNSLGSEQNVSMDIRIVGGVEVDIRHRPFQVSLQLFGQHFCGGALITRDTVLTAAHCFGKNYTSVSTFYEAKVGSNTTEGQAIKIQSVLVHPSYDSETIDNDISLIKLQSNVTISDTVALIRVSDRDNYVAGSYATVSGWGYQEENGTISSLLRKVDVPITSRKQCERDYAGIVEITRRMICAGYPEGGKDACQGDSGGPLVQNGKLIGVVSFGMGCARKSYPGVYTNVAVLLDWVVANSNYSKNNTGDSGYFNFGERAGVCDVLLIFPVIYYALSSIYPI